MIKTSFYLNLFNSACNICSGDLEKNNGSILSTNWIFAFDAIGIDLVTKEYFSLATTAAAQYKTTNT
jgi:hypothetical protein